MDPRQNRTLLGVGLFVPVPGAPTPIERPKANRESVTVMGEIDLPALGTPPPAVEALPVTVLPMAVTTDSTRLDAVTPVLGAVLPPPAHPTTSAVRAKQERGRLVIAGVVALGLAGGSVALALTAGSRGESAASEPVLAQAPGDRPTAQQAPAAPLAPAVPAAAAAPAPPPEAARVPVTVPLAAVATEPEADAPAVTPVVAPTRCKIRVESTPKGAAVLYQGRPLSATTPLEISNLACDEQVRLAVVLEGYEIHQAHVLPTEEGVRLAPTLRRPIAHVAITSTPPGVSVLLDGKQVGKTPLVLETRGGRQAVDLRMPGYESARRTVNLRPGEAVAVDVALSPRNEAVAAPRPVPKSVPGVRPR